MSITEFSSLDLKPELLTMINEKGFKNPTPIQAKSIPLALAGHDIIGQAQTGTGKTAAFGIPILNRINKGQGIQALILCPTRELAVQVSREIAFLGRGLGIRVLSVYGGQSIERQIAVLKRAPEIVVATTGRLLDHMRRKTISLSTLKFVVVDEADEMLDMGFFPDIKMILRSSPQDRQTLLFSATLDYEVQKLGQRFMREPQTISVSSENITVSRIEQSYYKVLPKFKVESIVKIIDAKQPHISLVFCRTKRGTDDLARRLKRLGYETDSLHGDMSQRERDTVMHRFRNKRTKILIATDLAARGLDISHVTHVFNYDIPEDSESYVHRIGRTGRAGKTGTAITLVEPEQFRYLRAIEKFIGKRIPQESLDAIDNKDLIYKMVENEINTKNKNTASHQEIAQELLQKHETTQLVASLVSMVLGEAQQAEGALGAVRDNKGSRHSRQARRTTPVRKSNEARQINELDMINMEVPVGRRLVRNKGQLIDYILSNTTLSTKQIGDIEVEQDNIFIEVPINKVDEVYNAIIRFKPGWQKNTDKAYKNLQVPVTK